MKRIHLFAAGSVAFLFVALGVDIACGPQGQPQVTGPEIEAGVQIANGICQEVGALTGDPWVTLLCPFLDRNGAQVLNADGSPKTLTVTMPREQWMMIKARGTYPRDGGGQ